MNRVSRTVYGLVVLMCLSLAGSAYSQGDNNGNQRDPEVEQEIYDRLAEIAPDAVPVFQQATEDMDAANYEAAQAGYEEVLTLAPDFPDALRRLSYVVGVLGDTETAVEYAQRAYDIDPHPFNASALAVALLMAGNASEALGYAREAVEAMPDDMDMQYVLALVQLHDAADRNDVEAVADASARLIELTPDNPLGYFFAGLVAADQEKWIEAERQLLKAQELGWPADEVQSLLDDEISDNANSQRREDRIIGWLITFVYVSVGWLGGMIVLLLAGMVLSRLTMPAAGQTHTASISGGERAVRQVYRGVIALASLYYYVSIPLLGVIVLIMTGGIFYGFLSIGRIPIRLAIGLLLLLVYTLIALGRCIFVRPKRTDPGRRLRREEAPDLWGMVEDVAARVGTRPVTVVFLTPGTQIAVTEQGGMLEKLRDRGERQLILGLGAVACLNQGELQAILAHEYGHFSHRDTAGGNLAYQVRTSMREMAVGLATSGQARNYNPAWLFLKAYDRVYTRITLGASRLQEILADRYAAMAYGPANFSSGLTSLVRQSVLFDAQVNKEVNSALKEDREVKNVWLLPPLENANEVEQAIEKLLNRPASAYDSHPPPNTRIALIQHIEPTETIEPNTEPAEALLPNLPDLQNELMQTVRKNVKQQLAMLRYRRRPHS